MCARTRRSRSLNCVIVHVVGLAGTPQERYRVQLQKLQEIDAQRLEYQAQVVAEDEVLVQLHHEGACVEFLPCRGFLSAGRQPQTIELSHAREGGGVRCVCESVS